MQALTAFAVLVAGLIWAVPAVAQIARVLDTKGANMVERAGKPPRILGQGEQLDEKDVISVARDSYAVLEFRDQTRITLRPNTVFRLDTYRDKESESMLFGLVKGGFRAVTGLVGKTNPKAVNFNTATATIGIRGTEFDARLCEDDCAAEERARPAPQPLYGPVARVVEMNGVAAAAARAGETARMLVPGAAIYEREGIATGPGSYLVLVFRDGSRISLAERSQLGVDAFEFNDTTQSGRAVVRHARGGARVATGSIAKQGPDYYRFITPLGEVRPLGTGWDSVVNVTTVTRGPGVTSGEQASGSVQAGGVASVSGTQAAGAVQVSGAQVGGVAGAGGAPIASGPQASDAARRRAEANLAAATKMAAAAIATAKTNDDPYTLLMAEISATKAAIEDQVKANEREMAKVQDARKTLEQKIRDASPPDQPGCQIWMPGCLDAWLAYWLAMEEFKNNQARLKEELAALEKRIDELKEELSELAGQLQELEEQITRLAAEKIAADSTVILVWNGAVVYRDPRNTRRVENGTLVFSVPGGTRTANAENANANPTGAPRPDRVKVDPELFGPITKGVEAGLYVWVREGVISLDREGKTVDVPAGSAAVATSDKVELLELVPNFLRFDLTPRPRPAGSAVADVFVAADGSQSSMCRIR